MANLGGGVNLGSATLFLLVDGSRMRRDLDRHARDYENFQDRVAKTAAAISKSSEATLSANVARGAQSVVDSSDFTDAQKKLQDQIATTSLAVQKSYAERRALLAASHKAEEAAAAKTRTLNEKQVDTIQKINASLAEQVRLKTLLAGKAVNQTTGKPITLSGAAKVSTVSALQAEVANQKKLQSSLSATKGQITKTQNALGKALAGYGASIGKTVADQEIALSDLTQSIRGQEAEWTRLAQVSDAAGRAQVNSARIAANQVSTNIERMIAATERFRVAQARVAANPRDASAIREYEQASIAQRAAQQNLITSADKLAAKNAELARVTSATAAKRARDEETASQRVIKAQAAELKSKELLQRNMVEDIGRVSGRAFAGGAIGIGLATKEFASFEARMTAVASIADDVNQNFDEFSASVQQIAIDLGLAPTDLADGLYGVAQAGFEGAEALKILEVAAKAAVAGETTVEEAARPLIGVINGLGYSVDEASEAMNILFAGVTEGVFSFADLADQLGDNISTAQSLGVSLEELMATYVVLTRRSNSLAESTTQVNAIMNSFLKPSKAMSEAVVRLTGESAEMFFQTHSLAEVLELTNRMFAENAESAGKLFPNLRAIRGIYGLTNDEVSQYADALGVVNKANSGQGALAQVLSRTMESTAFQLKVAREQFRQFAIVMGGVFAPSIVAGAKALGGFAESLANAPSEIQATAGGLVLFSTAAAGLVLVASKVIFGIKGIVDVIKDLNVTVSRGQIAWGLYAAAAAAVILVYQKVQDRNNELAASYGKIEDAISRAGDESDKFALKQARIENVSLLGGLINVPEESEDVKKNVETVLKHANAEISEFSLEGFKLHFADNQALQEYVYDSQDVVRINQAIGNSFLNAEEDGSKYLDIQGKIRAMHEGGALAGELEADALEKIDQLLANNDAPEKRAVVLSKLNKLTQDYQVNIDRFGAPKAGLLFLEGLENIDQSSIDATAKSVASLTEEQEEFTGQSEEAVAAAEAFAEAMTEIKSQAMLAAGSVDDLSDPINFFKQKLGENFTVPQALFDLAEIGTINLDANLGDLSGLSQDSLEVAAAMDTWKQKIGEVNASLQANQDEMSFWQGLSEAVTDSLGDQEYGFSRLQGWYERGAISQQQFSSITQAGNQILDQAVVAQDELRLAQAKSLPQLAEYVNQYRLSAEAYNALDDEQKVRIEALRDEKNAMILLSVVMLKFLQASGQIEAIDYNNFISGIAGGNAEMAALLDSVGLLPDAIKMDLQINSDNAHVALDAVNDRIAELESTIAYARKGLSLANPENQSAFEAMLANADRELLTLTEQRRVLELEVQADTTDVDALHERAEDIRVTEEEINAEIERQDELQKEAEKSAEAIADRIREIRDAWKEAANALHPSLGDLTTLANDTIPDILANIRPGLDDPWAWLTQGTKDANLTFTEFLANTREISGTDLLDLDDDARAALDMKNALDASSEALQEVTDNIQRHQSAISQYKGYQSLIEDVLGSTTSNLDQWNEKLALGKVRNKEFNEALKSGDAHGQFDKLTAMVERHAITQEEANYIRQEAIYLNDLLNGGIAAEEERLVRSIPALRQYVMAHMDAAGGYENLTEKQKGFLAALEDENVQAALSTTIMLAQLEALGAAPEGVAERFVSAMRKVNPVFGALVDDIGLLATKTNTIEVEARIGMKKKPSDVIRESVPREGVEVPVTPVEARGSGRARSPQGVNVNAQEEIQRTMTQAQATLSSSIAQLEALAAQGGREVSTAYVMNLTATILVHAALVRQRITDYAPLFLLGIRDAQAGGAGTGSAFSRAIIEAINQNRASVESTVTNSGPLSVMNKQVTRAFDVGKRVGTAFLAGTRIGASDANQLQRIEDAGAAAGKALERGTNEELEIASPSQKGIDAGQAFTKGIGIGVESDQDELEYSGRKLAGGLTDAVNDILSSGAGQGASSMASAIAAMAESEGNIDYRQLEKFADQLERIPDNTGRLGRASSAIRSMAESAKTDLENISSSGQDFGSNLEYAADQIAAFRGDKTPKQFVDMSLNLRKMAESTDQLDAAKLRAYASQLRATGDAGLKNTATYLDSIAADIDERARRHAITEAHEAASEQGEAAAGGYMQSLRDEIERRQGDLPDPLKRLAQVSESARYQAGKYLAAAMRGDSQAMVAEYNRLKAILDPSELQKIAAAGGELLRKGMPRGFAMQDDWTIGASQEVVALAESTLARQRAQEAGESLASSNDDLATSYDRVNSSASGASRSVGSSGGSFGGGGGGGATDLPEALKRYAKLSAEVKSQTAAFIRANLNGDEAQVVAEFNRIKGSLDAHALDLVAAAGRELRTRGVPKGFVLTPQLDLVPAIDALVDSMPQLRTAITDTFHGIEGVASRRMMDSMMRFLASFIAGHRQAGLQAWGEITDFMSEEGQKALYELAVSLRGDGYGAGRAAGEGLAAGASAQNARVRGAGQRSGQELARGVNQGLGISSPSRVTGESGRNAAQSFVDRFIMTARGSIMRIRQTAKEQVTAYGDEVRRGAQMVESSAPDLQFGIKQTNSTARLNQQRRAAERGNRGPVQVQAPFTVDVRVEGYDRDPRSIARELKQEIWGDLVDGIERVWSQVEGATA